MSGRMDIETVKDFRIRHQDIYFAIALILISIPIHTILISIAKGSSASSSTSFWVTIGLIIFDLLLIAGIVFYAWYHFRERKSEVAYIENGHLIKKQNDYLIFDFPLESIVSVRVQQKKGLEGTVILFTEKESVNYFVSNGLKNNKLSLHGFTDYKISFVKDRKQLLTEIYKANPKLHFIESF